jgi:hypothetical protein
MLWGDQEMLTNIMSCRHLRHYLERARHLVEVLTDYHNLQWFMTTKSLKGQQARWWETLSSYNLNIVYRAGKKNPANAPSHWPDYTRVPEGRYAPTILTARCNTTFCLQQLYATAVQENRNFKDVPLNNLTNLIIKGQAENHTARKACTALSLPEGYSAEQHSVPATLLR